MQPYKNIINRFSNGIVLQVTCADLKEIIKQERVDALTHIDLNTCGIKGCNNSWNHRVCILDMCQEHYDLWIKNGGQKK